MKVLFIIPYPTEGPSNRYRVEQYFPYLKKNGIDYMARPLISSDFFKILYKKGNTVKKILYFLVSTANRFLDALRVFRYDIVFVHLESFLFGPAFFEYFFQLLGKPVIYDFEDAVYLKDFKGKNKFLNLLRCSHKFYDILRLSSQVIVCNNYMKDLVLSYNRNVTVIPTSIDTDMFKLKDFTSVGTVPVIGWIGSHTTLYCLDYLKKVLIDLSKEHDFVLKIIGGGKNFAIPGVRVINEEWNIAKDVENFQGLDIGIYPLPLDERAMAKTPFKTIQYMSVGVPAIASKVGGNNDIIQDGVNGFLASNEKEWFDRLSLLIKNADLRKRVGLAGRKTVEERYSVKVNAQKFISVLQVACQKRSSKQENGAWNMNGVVIRKRFIWNQR